MIEQCGCRSCSPCRACARRLWRRSEANGGRLPSELDLVVSQCERGHELRQHDKLLPASLDQWRVTSDSRRMLCSRNMQYSYGNPSEALCRRNMQYLYDNPSETLCNRKFDDRRFAICTVHITQCRTTDLSRGGFIIQIDNDRKP
ncbi:hypothetical protein F2P81_002802 [Scophthalmus maximus]|uniref:Uncharacterized protein n=1 Tax=Scophthalmus maximus TaxID=52904 RepID=A0A6A4TJQ0_SCOMX|nr:hypothetical protein F2P81_002802 [Scophthalmus maximus]